MRPPVAGVDGIRDRGDTDSSGARRAGRADETPGVAGAIPGAQRPAAAHRRRRSRGRLSYLRPAPRVPSIRRCSSCSTARSSRLSPTATSTSNEWNSCSRSRPSWLRLRSGARLSSASSPKRPPSSAGSTRNPRKWVGFAMSGGGCCFGSTSFSARSTPQGRLRRGPPRGRPRRDQGARAIALQAERLGAVCERTKVITADLEAALPSEVSRRARGPARHESQGVGHSEPTFRELRDAEAAADKGRREAELTLVRARSETGAATEAAEAVARRRAERAARSVRSGRRGRSRASPGARPRVHRSASDLNAGMRPDLSDLASGFLRDLAHSRYTASSSTRTIARR